MNPHKEKEKEEDKKKKREKVERTRKGLGVPELRTDNNRR